MDLGKLSSSTREKKGKRYSFSSVLKLHPASTATYTPRFYCGFSNMQL